jgi:hypothetical protein
MSVRSSVLDVAGGAGGGTGVTGSAAAVPSESAEIVISTTVTDNHTRFVTRIAPQMVHTSRLSGAKLAPWFGTRSGWPD